MRARRQERQAGPDRRDSSAADASKSVERAAEFLVTHRATLAERRLSDDDGGQHNSSRAITHDTHTS